MEFRFKDKHLFNVKMDYKCYYINSIFFFVKLVGKKIAKEFFVLFV